MEPEAVEHNLLRHPYTFTTTTLLRLGQVTSSSHATKKRRSLYVVVVVVVQSTIPIFTAAPMYVYSHILYSKQTFKKFLGPFRGPQGARRTHFRIPLPATRTLVFFPASPPQFTPCEAVKINLLR